MAFFVYGIDPKTGETVSRFFADATTEADARLRAEQKGLHVTAVVPSHSTSAIVLPERPPPQPTEADVAFEEAKVTDRESAEFNRTLDEITPRVVVTYWLVGANVLVFILMTVFGANILDPSTADLLRWGAEYGPRTASGESWRLLSSLFVHIGIMHLVYNMIAFLYVAPTVERMLGHAGFLLTYLIAGIAGGLWAFFYNPTQLHAGASGAIFGIYGALLALLLLRRKDIPPHILAGLRNFALIFIAYNLINSLRPDISLTAHIGGLVGGFLCGLVLAQTFGPNVAGRAARQVALAVGGMALFACGMTIADSRYPNLGPLLALLDRGNATIEKFNLAQKKGISDADFATLIEHDLLPEWKATRAGLERLTPVPPGLHDNVQAIVGYMALRQEHWEALLNTLHESKGRAWLHSYDGKADDKEEIQRGAHILGAYIHAGVDLKFATRDPKDRSGKLQHLQQLAIRANALDDRNHVENMRDNSDRNSYGAFLEREALPELHSIEQGITDLPPLPPDLAQDATAILDYLHMEQPEWELRVAYDHYEHSKTESDAKASRADSAARAIRNTSGVRLLAPY